MVKKALEVGHSGHSVVVTSTGKGSSEVNIDIIQSRHRMILEGVVTLVSAVQLLLLLHGTTNGHIPSV
jgi:hypothetical protein